MSEGKKVFIPKALIVVALVLAAGVILYNKDRSCAPCEAGGTSLAAVPAAPAVPAPASTVEPAPAAVETVPASVDVPAALPRLIELGSAQCRACQMMKPVIAELRNKYKSQLDVELIDVRVQREAAMKHKIRVIPTQIFLDADGIELFRHEGFFALKDIVAKWNELGVSLE